MLISTTTISIKLVILILNKFSYLSILSKYLLRIQSKEKEKMKMIKIHKENSHALTAHLELLQSKRQKIMAPCQSSLLIPMKIWLKTKKIIVFMLKKTALILTFFPYQKNLDFTVFKKNLKAIFFPAITVCHRKRVKSLKITLIVIKEQLKVGLKLSRSQRETLDHMNLIMTLTTTNNSSKENSNSQLMSFKS